MYLALPVDNRRKEMSKAMKRSGNGKDDGTTRVRLCLCRTSSDEVVW
jgi:hypothetical protein